MKAVAATSRWIAAVRAREADQETPLFSDPFAATLAGEQGFAFLDRMLEESPEGPRATNIAYIRRRTRFLDDFLADAVKTMERPQVVMLAAGLDSRAYRMAWPSGTTLYEIDLPEVIAYKNEVLEQSGADPQCRRIPIPCDLRNDWPRALQDAGFEPSGPAAWLIEGLLMYLPEDAVRSIVERVSVQAAPGSRLGLDLINADFLEHRSVKKLHSFLSEIQAPWVWGVNDPENFLLEYGWDATVVQPGELDMGDWPLPVFPREQQGRPRTFFATATRTGT